VEDRLNQSGRGRAGPAVIALVAILAITVGWWALALWPAGPSPPAWLARTRSACFGAETGGLPDFGGWILLIGQPLGMIGFLLAGWRDSLRRDLARVFAARTWRVMGPILPLVVIVGILAIARKQAVDEILDAPPAALSTGIVIRPEVSAPDLVLVDQYGSKVALNQVGKPVLVTFAYGHCVAVCPTIVHDLEAARARTERSDLPIFVVTLDPWRDTPERLSSIAAAWGFATDAGEDRVLSGPIADVEQVLDRIGIGRRRDPDTGELDHSATVLLVDGDGRIAWRLDGDRRPLGQLLSSVR